MILFLIQGCPDECLATNLTLCYGASVSQCCNVYFNNSCAVQCPTNYSASQNTNFICGKTMISTNVSSQMMLQVIYLLSRQ